MTNHNESNEQAMLEWIKEAQEHLNYDHVKGIITVKKAYQESPIGKVIGFSSGQGYMSASFKGKRVLLHRLAWVLFYGEIPSLQIDHINGIRSDNRISNLRLATHAENCRNAKTPITNSSGIKGVYFDKNRKKYTAHISVNNHNKTLGRFNTAEEAAEARRQYADALYGDFANHG